MTKRTMTTALLLATLAPPAAHAAPRFTASLEAEQTTRWNVPQRPISRSCQGQQYMESGGEETIRLTARPKRIALDGGVLPATGTVRRDGRIRYTLDPGECHDSGDPTSYDTGPYDCGTRPLQPYVRVRWYKEVVEVDVPGAAPFDDCPAKSKPVKFREIRELLSARRVGSQKRIVVRARDTETTPLPYHGVMTVVTTWTLTLKRR